MFLENGHRKRTCLKQVLKSDFINETDTYLLRLMRFIVISSATMNSRHRPYTIRVISFEAPDIVPEPKPLISGMFPPPKGKPDPSGMFSGSKLPPSGMLPGSKPLDGKPEEEGGVMPPGLCCDDPDDELPHPSSRTDIPSKI